jgi:imidazolonepropionase-like amidohydrolase
MPHSGIKSFAVIALLGLGCARPTTLSPHPLTLRYEVLIAGRHEGAQVTEITSENERRVSYEFNDRGRGPRLTTRMVVNPDGTPALIDTAGHDYLKAKVEEHFSIKGQKAEWRSSASSGEKVLSGSAFYDSVNSVPEEGAQLARALLASPDHRLALLPEGEARIQAADEVEVRSGPRAQGVRQYAIDGLGLGTAFIWLDDDRNFFASVSPWRSIVREGWKDVVPVLLESDDKARAKISAKLATSLGRPLGRKWVLRGANLFDSERGKMLPRMSIVGSDNRILAVGPESLELPPDAEVLDVSGKSVLPGLWDMHAHLFENQGPQYIACGVTTARDLANNIDLIASLRRRWDAREAIGPRIVAAGFLDGPGPYAGPTGILVGTEEEARAAIDRYAQLGYEQIKIYSSIKPELVPAIVKHSHSRGLRVSGHIPFGMNAEEAVRMGFDELQHSNFLFLNFLVDKAVDTRTPLRFTKVAEHAAELDLDSPQVQAFIALLKERKIVVDPTLGTFEQMFLTRPGQIAPTYASIAQRLPPLPRRSLATGGLPATDADAARNRESFRALIRMVGLLYRAGVPLVAGTDAAFPGFVLHRELELYVEAGVPAPAVLQIATLGAAKVMKHDKDLGSVSRGKMADLIIVDGDPSKRISDIRRVVKVIKNGVIYDAAELQRAIGVNPG